MSEWNEQVDDLIERVKQQRDELRVRLHLGTADAKDEWARLDKKVERFLADADERWRPLRGAVSESAKEVGTALELVGEEIQKGYDRIRKLLKDQGGPTSANG